MRFSREQRLRSRADFNRPRNEGFTYHCGAFTLRCFGRAADAVHSRFGVIASKRVGKAVTRNRAKRVFRALFRLNQDQLITKCDVILIVRSGFDSFSYQTLEKYFIQACGNYVRYTARKEAR